MLSPPLERPATTMKPGDVEEGRILDMQGCSILMHYGEGCPLAKGSGIVACSIQCTMVGLNVACSSVLELFTRELHSNGRLRPTVESEPRFREHACTYFMHDCNEVTRAHVIQLRVG
jgi:hypothetical protein